MASAYRWALIGTAVGVPIFFVPDITFGPYSLPKLALLTFGLAIALAILFADLTRGSKHSFTRLAVPATAIVLPLTIAWFWSPYQEWALFGQYSRLNGLLPYALVALLGILVADAFEGRAHLLALALAIAGGLIGTYAFVQAIGLDPFWSPGEGGASEYPPSTIGHFNFVGGFLGICLPLSIYSWIKGSRYRLWGAGSTIAVTIGLLLSNSQGGWAAGIAGTSIIVGSLLGERFRSARRVGLFGAALVACLMVAAVVASSFLPRWSLLGGTIRERGRLWATALEMGADSPLIGHGPASYSVEGVRYRPLASVVAEGGARPDEPHSVPLSFWANAGALGAAGFLVLAGWIIATGLRIRALDHLSTAFFAACIAYLVQSLVSIDQLPLRSALWIAISGIALSITPNGREVPVRSPRLLPRGMKAVTGILAAVTISVVGLYFAGGLLMADHHAENAREHFSRDEAAAGKVQFEHATSFRFEPVYLDLYGQSLGAAALEQGLSGADLIHRMRAVYGYLKQFPDTSGILNQARLLHYWGQFQPSADIEAQRLLERARRLDPENPLIDALLSEVLIDLGLTEKARLLLERWAPTLDGHLPTYWGALSIARLLDGDPAGAESALTEGLSQSPSECRVQMAEEFLRHHDNPSLSVTPAITLTLRLACGEGASEFFLGHLPDVK